MTLCRDEQPHEMTLDIAAPDGSDWRDRDPAPEEADFDVVELVCRVDRLVASGNAAGFPELFERWLHRHADDPLRWAAYFNYAVLLNDDGHHAQAAAGFAETIRLAPGYLPAYVAFGSAFEALGRIDDAVSLWLQAADYPIPVDGESIGIKVAALTNIARVAQKRGDMPAVEVAIRRCIDIDPRRRDVLQQWIVTRASQCKWPVIEAVGGLTRSALMAALQPLSASMQTDDPMFQLANASRFFELDIARPSGAHTVGRWVPPAEPRTRPLRVGYVSPDLRAHPVGYLTAELFGMHDRARVEVFAYYSGPVQRDDLQAHIRSTVDHWREIAGWTDKQTARAIVDDEIDVLVDLGGHTNASPTAALALRPAPVIANWLGYPGTMGSPHHQYIIADMALIPPAYEKYYSERVVRLPCYQPSNRQRTVGGPWSREQMGLDGEAMVYCCFNGTEKITPVMFRCWMAILLRVPHAVLWLLTSDADTELRLRQRAAGAGVSPDRLVFAPKYLNAEHLARYDLADLCLDTWPYGAHTTASDALWIGVPMVTIAGLGFAARVCASLTSAAGLPELVCASAAAYEDLAVHLGTHPDELRALRERLRAGRDRCVLFDIPLLVTRLESLYEQMWDEYVGDRIPNPDLTNLGIYHTIGCELEHATGEFPDLATYERRYATELAYRDAVSPIPDDRRLWGGPAALRN